MKFIHSKIAIVFLLLISNVHIAYSQLASNQSVGLSSANYKLVWQDNFDGTQLDETNNWSVEVNGNGVETMNYNTIVVKICRLVWSRLVDKTA